MSLPIVTCPACSAAMSLEALLGHQGARDALLALSCLHASTQRLQRTALRYVGLFAPAKQVMRMDRVATLLEELGKLIATGRVEHKGRSWVAPVDYWIAGMEDMLDRRDTLSLPLKSHGYLKTIVANYGDRSEAQAERHKEAQLRGDTPVGNASPVPIPVAPTTSRESNQTKRMPTAISEALTRYRQGRAHTQEHNDEA